MSQPAAATTITYTKIVFVVNPNSCKGRGRALFERSLGKIRSKLGDRLLDVLFTESAGDGAAKARRAAVELSADLVVAVGGDGTAHEVLNGLMDNASRTSKCAMALWPAGTGNDFAKTMKLTVRADKYKQQDDVFLEAIAQGRTIQADAGHVQTTGEPGQRDDELTQYFLNETSFGISADVMYSVNHGRVWFTKDITFQLQSIAKQFTYTNRDVAMSYDGNEVQGLQQLTAVSNGQYFGSGMQVNPSASLTSGKFAVCTLGDVGARDVMFSILPGFYEGTHGTHERVSFHAAQTVHAKPTQQENKVYVESDGELLGSLPATMTCLPGALRLVVPERYFQP